jgi:hypothetical protein
MGYPVSAILIFSQVADVAALTGESPKLANKNINTSRAE